ncbi:MAG: c-type cytochrome domain-containing protein, partial [Verrucomicrobiota bacterium]
MKRQAVGVISLTLVALCLGVGSGQGEASWSSSEIEFFESRIRPVLAQECYECHSSTGKQKAGLILDHRQALLDGGDTGPAILPGNAEESLLIEAIKHLNDLTMPKAGVMLEERIIQDFEEWVNMGAPDPRDAPPTAEELAQDTNWPAILERRKAWWSFQPIQAREVPDGEGTEVDRFIARKLEEKGLESQGGAEPHVLLRRLHYTLVGLPPQPREVEATSSPTRWAGCWSGTSCGTAGSGCPRTDRT